MHQRDLLSKRIKAAKRNSPAIDKILKKREKPLWYSRWQILGIVAVFGLFAFLAHGHTFFPSAFSEIHVLGEEYHEILVAIHSGIGAVLIGLAFFVAQEIARGENNQFPYKGIILLKRSQFLYLLIAEVLVFFILFWRDVNTMIIMPIFVIGIYTLFSVHKTFGSFLNSYELEKEERTMLFDNIKKAFLKSLDLEMEQVIGSKEVASSLKGSAIDMNSWLIPDEKEYTAIKSRKSGMVTDLDVQKLKEIAFSNNDAAEFGLDKPCYRLGVDSLHYHVNEGETLLWVRNDLLANKKQKEKIERLVHKAFNINESGLNLESLRNDMGVLRVLSLKLLKQQQEKEFGEALNYYRQLFEAFYSYAEPYSEELKSQWNSIPIFGMKPNPARWITNDIQEIFEHSVEAKSKFALTASYLPFALMGQIITHRDFSIFDELRYYPYRLYRQSLKARDGGNDEKADLLFNRSWRNSRDIIRRDLRNKIEDGEYPVEWIERFAFAVLLIFQDLLKASFDKRDFDSFEKYLSVTTKLFRSLENMVRYDNIDRTKGLVDSLNQKNQEVLFGLSGWILNKWRTDSEKGSVEKFYNAIEAKMPSEIEPFTRLFLRCHHFDKVNSHGWNSWEFEGKEGGETYRVNSFAHLEQFYAVKALSLLAGYTDEQIATINLPTSRDFADLAGGSGSVVSILDHIKNNSDQWQPVLTDAAIEKVDAFKKLLAKAKDAQEQQEFDEVKERPISEHLVRKCKDGDKKSFRNSAIMRDIFIKHFNAYDDQTANEVGSNDGWLTIKEIITKEIFLDNWHVSGVGVHGVYGAEIARFENNYLFDEIAKCCEQIDEGDFETTLAQFANVNDVVIITTHDSFWTLFSSSQNFKHRWEEGVQQLDIKGFEGWYDFNKNKIPVFSGFHHRSDNPVLIVDKTTVGRIVQLSPLYGNYKEECVEDIFYMDIRAFSHDEQLMNELIANPTQRLQQEYETEDERREYLRGQVLVEIFERFKYEVGNDFEGYILFTPSERASLFNP